MPGYIPRDLIGQVRDENASWDLTTRPAMFPFLADYTNRDTGEHAGGLAVPSMIQEPMDALMRLIGTPSNPGTFTQGPDYGSNADDMRTLLETFLGGNATRGMGAVERGAAQSAVTSLPAAVEKSAPSFFDVWHGSPHDFDAFDMSKIGTGEGAQAYGHGLYFAEKPGIAKSYQRALSEGDNPGYLYQARVDASPNDFLDWDKPPSQQPQAVQDLFQNTFGQPLVQKGADGWSAVTPTKQILGPFKNESMARAAVSSYYDTYDIPVGKLLKQQFKDADIASQLRDAGIPGIRYFDSASRNAGEGTRNYVLFSDDPVNVIHKWHGDQQLFSDNLPSLPGAVIAGAEKGNGLHFPGSSYDPSSWMDSATAANGRLPPRVTPMEMTHGPMTVDGYRGFMYEPQNSRPDIGSQSIDRTLLRDPGSSMRETPFWASDSPNIAQTYADVGYDGSIAPYGQDTAGAIAPVRANFQNPLIVDAEGGGWSAIPFEGGYPSTDTVARIARERGHDGIIFQNIRDAQGGGGDPSTSFAALKRGTVTSPLTGETLYSDGLPSLWGSALQGQQNQPYPNSLFTY